MSISVLVPFLLPVATWACCMIPQPPVENYREKVGLPMPNSKTSDSTIYPNLPRYGINCGHNMYWNLGDNGLVVGGVEAYENELPYQVLIGYGILYCGGAILNHNIILTAAHCGCEDTPASGFTVTAGQHMINLFSGREQVFQVSQVFSHPNYNSVTDDNDFCLLKLATSIEFNQYVQPACLPLSCSDECPDGSEVLISGWGALDYGYITLFPPLQKAKVPIVPRSTCAAAYSNVDVPITDNMICAGYYEAGGFDACQGDSGGPMVCYREGYFQVDGVVSFATGCGSAEYPGVYARVCQVLDWIDSTIGAA